MASEYTPNYNLDLYASTDRPNLRDQYNAAMGKIDTQMKANADGVTNANANVGTLQTRVSSVEEDVTTVEGTVSTQGESITALGNRVTTVEGTVSTQGESITALGNRVTTVEGTVSTQGESIGTLQSNVTSLSSRVDTADGNISTNTSDIIELDTRMDTAETDIDNLQASVNGKAPTSHASTSNTYGQGSPSQFGHVKVTDEAGSTAASSGTAASPTGVQNAISKWLTPDNVPLTNPSSGRFDSGMNQCAVYRLWKIIKFTFSLVLAGTGNPDYVTICRCSDIGIPNPSSPRIVYGGVRSYKAGSNAQMGIGNLYVQTNGNIQVEGWNTVGGSRVDWGNVSSIQIMIDYSQW